MPRHFFCRLSVNPGFLSAFRFLHLDGAHLRHFLRHNKAFCHLETEIKKASVSLAWGLQIL